MRGDTPPLPQFAFMAWCSVEAQGQLSLYLYTPVITNMATCETLTLYPINIT